MTPPRDWSTQGTDPTIVAALIRIVIEADETFQKRGGGLRAWVAECFLPALNRHQWFVDTVADVDDDSLERS